MRQRAQYRPGSTKIDGLDLLAVLLNVISVETLVSRLRQTQQRYSVPPFRKRLDEVVWTHPYQRWKIRANEENTHGRNSKQCRIGLSQDRFQSGRTDRVLFDL